MFTGLVEEVGVIRRIERRTGGARLVIGAAKVLEGTNVGDSISVSGACLTVTVLGCDDFVADSMPETLARTTLGKARTGTEVNLERSLTWGGRLGGHLVLGHVDAVVVVEAVERRGESLEVRLSLPPAVAAFVAEKGSVTLDGVSLTVMSVGQGSFSVGLIPHTVEATTLRALAKGSLLNMEADVMARYVYRALEVMASAGGSEALGPEGLTLELLMEKGFA
jgi:riboflavin synthase